MVKFDTLKWIVRSDQKNEHERPAIERGAPPRDLGA